MPDLPVFRRWVDRRHEAARRLAEEQKIAEFLQRRDALLRSLSPADRQRYESLAQVCTDIEAARADAPPGRRSRAADPRLRKLDELMWGVPAFAEHRRVSGGNSWKPRGARGCPIC